MRKVWICSICYKENLPESIYILDKCEHKFCPECLAAYIRSLVNDGQIDIPCPECRMLLEYHEIQTLMNDELRTKYETFSIEKALSGMNDIVYCPSADCSIAYIRDPENRDMRCTKCGNNFCADCKKQSHPDIPNCSDVEQITKIRDEVASEAWIAGYTKPCPQCSYAIEKNGGCNHMTCKKCAYQFCWICLGQYGKCSSFSCAQYGGDVPENNSNRESEENESENDSY